MTQSRVDCAYGTEVLIRVGPFALVGHPVSIQETLSVAHQKLESLHKFLHLGDLVSMQKPTVSSHQKLKSPSLFFIGGHVSIPEILSVPHQELNTLNTFFCRGACGNPKSHECALSIIQNSHSCPPKRPCISKVLTFVFELTMTNEC